jgi:hypothetical protein
VLDRLVLTADLSEAPNPWHLVATIPFGDSVTQLGLLTDQQRTPVPYLPRSFAVAPDGSIWILDVLKHRLAHYSPTGRYLGEIGGFKFDRFSPHPSDVVFSGPQPYVVEEYVRRGILVTVQPDGSLRRTGALDGGNAVAVLLLYPDQPGVAGLVGGYADPVGAGPRGVAGFDPPASGTAHFLPGVPVGGDRWIDVRAPSDEDLEVVFTNEQQEAIRPIHIRGVSTERPGGRVVKVLAGPTIEAGGDGAAAIFVRISPARPQDAARYGGGVWLLRVAIDGAPLLWERLPDAEISNEDQIRHLAMGPDGRLYLMVPTKEGERIYSR